MLKSIVIAGLLCAAGIVDVEANTAQQHAKLFAKSVFCTIEMRKLGNRLPLSLFQFTLKHSVLATKLGMAKFKKRDILDRVIRNHNTFTAVQSAKMCNKLIKTLR